MYIKPVVLFAVSVFLLALFSFALSTLPASSIGGSSAFVGEVPTAFEGVVVVFIGLVLLWSGNRLARKERV